MAHPEESTDKDACTPMLTAEQWKKIVADAEKYAAEDQDDIEVPDHEPTDDDFDFTETPDEVTRGETLTW